MHENPVLVNAVQLRHSYFRAKRGFLPQKRMYKKKWREQMNQEITQKY